MNSIFIQNILLDNSITDIRIENGKFSEIGNNLEKKSTDTLINGSGMVILPPFYNMHTHAAMTLLRGYADDLPLFKWLSEYIWPFEAKLTEDDIYLGTRLAIIEMIKSGTVFFNDMYWHHKGVLKAVTETGIRAAVGNVILDQNAESVFSETPDYSEITHNSPLICKTINPHAIYTNEEKNLRKCAEIALERNLFLHIHLAETKQEYDDCVKAHGISPVKYLDRLGLLTDKTIAAHCVWLNREDMEILAERRTVIAHCPISNMKLSSGTFSSADCIKAGCRITLGTDGCSSNNNLDMREEMKFASLLAKLTYSPETLPVAQVFDMATKNGSSVFFNDCGEIAVGKSADAMLIKLGGERMTPLYNLLSNFIYSAESDCIDTVICAGKILMQKHKIPDEDEIIDRIEERVKIIANQ